MKIFCYALPDNEEEEREAKWTKMYIARNY